VSFVRFVCRLVLLTAAFSFIVLDSSPWRSSNEAEAAFNVVCVQLRCSIGGQFVGGGIQGIPKRYFRVMHPQRMQNFTVPKLHLRCSGVSVNGVRGPGTTTSLRTMW
jgi:hypothetical protein